LPLDLDLVLVEEDILPARNVNQVRVNRLEEEINLYEDDNIAAGIDPVVNNRNISTCNKITLVAGTTIIACGMGAAMMPVFNKEVEHLERYGINVHNQKAWFILSTLNSLVIYGIYSGRHLYKTFYNKLLPRDENNVEEIDEQNLNPNDCYNKCKNSAIFLYKSISSFSGAIVPIYLLWSVELNNQKVAGSHGFDKFIGWATFTTVPLVIFRCVHTLDRINKEQQDNVEDNQLDNLGSQIVVYGIDIAAFFARGYTYNHILSEICNNIGIDEDISTILGVVLGGLGANTICTISEHYKLKKLFTQTTDGVECKNKILATLASLEGAWLSLPVIGIGLDATEDMNPLLKGVLFFSMFASHSVLEGSSIYEAMMPNENVVQKHNIVLAGNNDLAEIDI
jgi:hypothetical protein